MSQPTEQFQHACSEVIRDCAMSFPQTTEGTSCVNRAFKAGGKNFVFLGEKDDECNIRLKLDTSIPEIRSLAASTYSGFEVGKGGWTLLRFPPSDPPPTPDLERWIAESFLLLAPKKVAALLDS